MHSLAWLISTATLFCVPLPIHAQPQATLSAWDALLRNNPSLIEDVGDLEREMLQLITEHQLQAYLQGTLSSAIILMNGETLAGFLMRNGASAFDLSWYSVDGGGGVISGEGFVLTGSVGQPDVGVMGGEGFTLVGGFLSIGPPRCSFPNGVFCDGFESGDLTEWSNSVGAN